LQEKFLFSVKTSPEYRYFKEKRIIRVSLLDKIRSCHDGKGNTN